MCGNLEVNEIPRTGKPWKIRFEVSAISRDDREFYDAVAWRIRNHRVSSKTRRSRSLRKIGPFPPWPGNRKEGSNLYFLIPPRSRRAYRRKYVPIAARKLTVKVMSSLAHQTNPLNGGSAENTSICDKFSIDFQVPRHLPCKRIWDRVNSPTELDAPQFQPIVRYVWVALDRSCKEPGRFTFGTWKSNATLLAMIAEIFQVEYKDRAFTDALKVLEKHGYIQREDILIAGRWQRMIFCLWRHHSDLSGCDINVGGVSIAAEELSPVPRAIRTTRVTLPPGSAKICTASAIKCGQITPQPPQESADDSGIELEELPVPVPVASLGREEETPRSPADGVAELVDAQVEVSPDPEPVPPPALTSVPPTISVEDARQMLAGRFRHNLKMMSVAVWVLIDAGLEAEIPEWFQGEKRPARPVVQVDPAPIRPSKLATKSAAAPAPIGKLDDLQTETLIYRLIELPADQAKQAAALIADRMADRWDDRQSLGVFRKRLSQVLAKQVSTEAFLKAYRAGEKSKPGADTLPDFKTRVFNTVIRPHLPKK